MCVREAFLTLWVRSKRRPVLQVGQGDVPPTCQAFPFLAEGGLVISGGRRAVGRCTRCVGLPSETLGVMDLGIKPRTPHSLLLITNPTNLLKNATKKTKTGNRINMANLHSLLRMVAPVV